MIIKSIDLVNFKNYKGKHHFTFQKLNLIKGENGVGKSTLGLHSILFAIYGYSEQTLSNLVFKGLNSCLVSLTLENNKETFVITRSYPTDIKIIKNGKDLELSNNAEKQKYLNDLFKDITYFKKFRMIDIKEGINLLESGDTALKEALFSINQDMFNDIRKRLLEKKHEREIYNQDTAVIYKHYPSEKRLNILLEGYKKVSNQFIQLQKELKEQENIYTRLYGDFNKIKGVQDYHIRQISQLNKLGNQKTCPTCRQPIDKKTLLDIVGGIEVEIKKVERQLATLQKDLKNEGDLVDNFRKIQTDIDVKKRKIELLKLKLDGRLKQKDFKFSTKDIIVIKEAIKELDNFSSYYLTKWLSSLEPIINSVIQRLGFNVKFIINEKGNFSFQLKKDNVLFTYKDLSTGQRLILSIAFKLAILLEKGEEGYIVADEGLASLDENNLNIIFELFRNLPFQLISIIHRWEENIPDLNVINLNKI